MGGFMPDKELERIKAENRLFQLQIDKDPEIQRIVDIAAETCLAHFAFIAFSSGDAHNISFATDIDLTSINENDLFPIVSTEDDEVVIIPDVQVDERWCRTWNFKHANAIRFYAAIPISTPDGHKLGSLCLMDRDRKELSQYQINILSLLSKQVAHLLEFDTSLKVLKEMFIEARSSEILLRSYFESSSSVYLLLNKELTLIAFNRAAVRFAKDTYQVDLIAGMKAHDYVHPTYVPHYLANCNEALKGNTMIVERQINYSGEEMWWQMTYEPARNRESVIIGVSYNSINITMKKEQELKIIAQNETLRKIAYLQSHELRKPVASIMGLMNIIKTEDYLTEREDLLMMERAVNELDEKIRMISSYADQVE